MRISPDGGTVEAADQIEERGFAGAGRPDDGDHLAARDLQVDGFERGDLALAVVELGDAGEGNHPDHLDDSVAGK